MLNLKNEKFPEGIDFFILKNVVKLNRERKRKNEKGYCAWANDCADYIGIVNRRINEGRDC